MKMNIEMKPNIRMRRMRIMMNNMMLMMMLMMTMMWMTRKRGGANGCIKARTDPESITSEFNNSTSFV